MKKFVTLGLFMIFASMGFAQNQHHDPKSNNNYTSLPKAPTGSVSFDPVSGIRSEIIIKEYHGIFYLTLSHYNNLSPEDQAKVKANPDTYYVHADNLSSEQAGRERKRGVQSLVK
jgi:hypothetical protein